MKKSSIAKAASNKNFERKLTIGLDLYKGQSPTLAWKSQPLRRVTLEQTAALGFTSLNVFSGDDMGR